MIILGVDPGLASTGVVSLDVREKETKLFRADLIRTQKANKKELQQLRMSADDERRLREIWDRLESVLPMSCKALAIEHYTPRPGSTGGNSWKCAKVSGLIMGFAYAHRLPVFVFSPQDIKRITGELKASKEQVATKLAEYIPNLPEALADFPKSHREHVSDAAALAWLCAQHMDRIEKLIRAA